MNKYFDFEKSIEVIDDKIKMLENNNENNNLAQIKRYNFLGGESFYNKRHNEFIKRLNESPYAKMLKLHT